MKKIISLVCGALTTLLLVSCSSEPKTASYQITFYDDAANILETVKVNQGVMPTYSKGTPTKESTESTNYTFNGWIPDIKPATADASYVASFSAELKKFTVTFDSDGGTEIAPLTVEWGKRMSGVPTPSKASTAQYAYKFEYWYDSTGSETVPFTMSTEIKRDYSLKAKWSETIKYYTVTFDSNGGSYVPNQSVSYGSCIQKPEDPTHDSSLSSVYTFDGWYQASDFSGEKFDFSTVITSDIKLHAKWLLTTREYTVTFYSDTDKVYSTATVKYNEKVSVPQGTPTKATDEVGQYTFTKWDFDFDTPIIGDSDIYAIYDINYVYYHYTMKESSCSQYGCKEFYGTKADAYSMVVPTKYLRIDEAGQATQTIIDEIASNNPDDERLLAPAHKFDDITGKCIYECGAISITGSSLDTSKLEATTEYKCPIEYGNMYKYNGSPVSIFTSYSLSGLTKIKFYLVNPDAGNTVILNGNAQNCVGGIYGGPGTYDGIIATKNGDDWVVTRASGRTMFSIVGGSFQDGGTSYTINNPSTIDQIFKTFSYAKTAYISDIIIEGTPSDQKEVLKNAYYVGKVDTKNYVLEETGEKVTGMGNKYLYKCLYGDTTLESNFRELFADIDITNFKTISFYIDLNKDNYLTFVDDDGSDASTSNAYGLHGKDGAHVPGIIKAYNLGNGSWKVTANGFQFRKVSNAAKATEYTCNNRNTLKSLFKIGESNSWQKVAMYVSDVIVTK